jgi:hypothetical protein
MRGHWPEGKAHSSRAMGNNASGWDITRRSAMSPVIDASLYWMDEPTEVSFLRVCDYLLSRGLEPARSYVDAEQAYFITSSQRVPRSQKPRVSRAAPSKIGVLNTWISSVARERGDHSPIGIFWGDATLPDTPAYELQQAGLRDYHFFTNLCRNLNPLYAELAGENSTLCAYDVLHWRRPYAPTTLYCRDALLSQDAPEFWSTYVYSEALGEGTYGTDLMFWNPRRKGTRLLGSSPPERGKLFRAAVHRAYRAHFGKQ